MPHHAGCRHENNVVGRGLTAMLVAGLAVSAGGAQGSEPVRSTAAAAREARIAAQLASKPDVVPSLADWGTGLEAFDARVDPRAAGEEGHVWAGARASLAKWRASAAGVARADAAAKLAAATAGLRIDDHEVFGTPQWVASTRALLTGPSTEAPADVAAAFVHANSALFEIDALEIPAAKVTRDYVTRHNGVRHLTLQQQHAGLDLEGCELRANLTRDGRLINVSSSMLPRPAGGFDVGVFKLDAESAIVAAARHVGVVLGGPLMPEGDRQGVSERRHWKNPPELRADEPVRTERAYFAMSRDDIRAAWKVVIPVQGVGHCYDLIIDAADGSLLRRHNRLVFETTQPVTMRVFTSDSPAPMTPGLSAPTGVQAPFVERDLVTMQPAMVRDFSPNGWIDDNNSETVGNNAAAHLDLDANNVPDLPRPNGGAGRVFDFPFDPMLAPSTYRDAAVVQMFYLCNVFHDRLYALGFDEVSGNFQVSNFGRGGSLTPDSIQADVHDGNGLGGSVNNANFNGDASDGSSARVQMYLFNGSNPDRDGALDASIVHHELAHGLSIRLVGGMFNIQSRGMGEGWSDYFGLSLLARADHDVQRNFVTGGYATHQLGTPAYNNNYYFGIRRFPYSIDRAINPLTFADIDPGQYAIPANVPRSPLVNLAISPDASSVHNQGEVWCSALLDARALLWMRDGFSANELMMQLVVDGMKLGPGNPTFLQSRDAILQADLVNNASANYVPLWKAFAGRGMGASATSPGSSTTSGVSESFLPPFHALFEYPAGRPDRMTPGRTTSFTVRITGTQLTVTPGTARLVYSVNGGAETTAALVPTGTPDEYLATLPAEECLSIVRFAIVTDSTAGEWRDPPFGAALAQAITSAEQVIFDDFEEPGAWTVGPNTAASGIWVRVDPNGAVSAPENDFTPAPGTMCWVTGNAAAGAGNGSGDVDGGFTTLTSPVFDLSGYVDARVSYARWYSNGTGSNGFSDRFRIDVSVDDGANWVNAETVGPLEGPDTTPGWRQATWSLTGVGVTPTSQVRVRFIAEDSGAASVVEAAIDDFRIERVLCDTTCTADFNGSGELSLQDLFDFLGAYLGNDPRGDFNGDQTLSVQDVLDYLVAYFTGC